MDRALVSSRFMNQFSEAKLTNMEISTSDHSPLLLEPKVAISIIQVKRFKFENAWLREPMCRHIVKEPWQMYQYLSFQEKIEKCSEMLGEWGKEITSNFRDRINRSKKIMKKMKGRRYDISAGRYRKESKKLIEAYNQQEVF